MPLYSLDTKIHIACFLSFFTYLIYYVSIKNLNVRVFTPKIGLNLCYAYSNLLLSFIGVFHFSLLSITWYYLLFLSIVNIYSVLISMTLLIIHLQLFLSLRQLFCCFYFFKDGLLIKYIDGRQKLLYFKEVKSFVKRFKYLGGFYFFSNKNGQSLFLYHGFLACNKELSLFIEDKIKQFSDN
ncbi:MAG: hypothetical protein COB02_15530 [Candidatus Cloacimonadota bacterium]|nr:MAG: hypothetical protein COB02_15530 [Candidatus Cloacimonadota bacterium]